MRFHPSKDPNFLLGFPYVLTLSVGVIFCHGWGHVSTKLSLILLETLLDINVDMGLVFKFLDLF